MELVNSDSLIKDFIKLGEVSEINASTINPSKFYEWINYTDISSVGEHLVQKPTRLSVNVAPSRARRKLKNGDIVISTVRPNRRSFFKFTNQWENAICSTGFVVISPKQIEDSDYLYSVLTSRTSTEYYESICEGGAYPAFNGSLLEEMLIPWPQQQTRYFIGALAGDLERKIEVNRQIASTFEQFAQTIFKSWFVDFDPVHAKARGEQPLGMDLETAALFPDSFEESELGPIPAGWRTVKTVEIANVLLGGTPSKSKPEYWGGDICWINSGEVNNYRIIEPSQKITELGLQNSSAKMLSKGTTVLAITGATLGQVSRIEIETTTNQSVIGLEPKSYVTNEYLYLWVLENINDITSKATGGAQQHINTNDVKEHSILCPPEELLIAFQVQVEPIFKYISLKQFESKSLSEIRDALIPRLISGEHEIPEELLVKND